MVYEESFASWPMQDSPKLAERWERSISELIRRDRNHPSVVTWALLNETPDSPQFRLAAASLPWIRRLDESRNGFSQQRPLDLSGDNGEVFSRLDIWHGEADREPWATLNPSPQPVETPFGFTWPARQVALQFCRGERERRLSLVWVQRPRDRGHSGLRGVSPHQRERETLSHAASADSGRNGLGRYIETRAALRPGCSATCRAGQVKPNGVSTGWGDGFSVAQGSRSASPCQMSSLEKNLAIVAGQVPAAAVEKTMRLSSAGGSRATMLRKPELRGVWSFVQQRPGHDARMIAVTADQLGDRAFPALCQFRRVLHRHDARIPHKPSGRSRREVEWQRSAPPQMTGSC